MMSPSRRSLLGGLSLAALATASDSNAGVFLRLLGRPASLPPTSGGSMPSLSPSAGWTGVAKSGGVPAVFPSGDVSADPITRTTAKPAIQWLVPSDLRLVGSRVYGVDADANGGLSGVVFHLEGNEVTVAAPSFYTDTDANGASRTRRGYWINVVTAATSGEARLFATAVPIDGRMQNRVIGFDAATVVNGNYPMSVFPRSAVNDGTYNVTPSGGTYTSILAAITQARTDAKEAPLILLKETTNYELVNSALSPTNYASGKGFCTIAADTGITATLGRAAAFTPNNSASWTWTPGWDGIEFRGSGIVLDQRNWTQLSFTSKPAWFNGCKFTNSIGARDSYYWNGGTHPGFGTSIRSYWDSVYVEFISQGNIGLQAQRYAQNCSIKQAVGDIFSGTHYVAGNYVRNWDGNFFQPEVTSLTVLYTNPGGHTTATVTKTGTGGAGGVLTLSVDGSTVLTLALGTTAADTYPTIQSVGDAINAFASGWSATVPARGGMLAAALGGEQGHLNPTNANAFGVTVSIISALGIHGDWWQGYCGASTRENVIIKNNVCRGDNTADNDAYLFNDDDSNGGHSFDHIVKGNIWVGGAAGAPNNYFGGSSTSHYVFENNTMQGEFVRREYINGNPAGTADVGDSTYSSHRNNLVADVSPFGYSGTGVNYPNSPPWQNNLYDNFRNYPMTGGSNTGNVAYTSHGFTSLFANFTNGDFRPAAGGTVLANLLPSVNAYDGRGLSFATNDIVGAWAATDPAPAYPF